GLHVERQVRPLASPEDERPAGLDHALVDRAVLAPEDDPLRPLRHVNDHNILDSSAEPAGRGSIVGEPTPEKRTPQVSTTSKASATSAALPRVLAPESIGDAHRPLIGGKAENLWLLTRQGFP